MKYKIVMELEFDDTVRAETIEGQIERHMRPMVNDTQARQPESPLLSGTLAYERTDIPTVSA